MPHMQVFPLEFAEAGLVFACSPTALAAELCMQIPCMLIAGPVCSTLTWMGQSNGGGLVGATACLALLACTPGADQVTSWWHPPTPSAAHRLMFPCVCCRDQLTRGTERKCCSTKQGPGTVLFVAAQDGPLLAGVLFCIVSVGMVGWGPQALRTYIHSARLGCIQVRRRAQGADATPVAVVQAGAGGTCVVGACPHALSMRNPHSVAPKGCM